MGLEQLLTTTRAAIAAGALAAAAMTPSLAQEPVRMIGLDDGASYTISSQHRSGDSCELSGTLGKGEGYALDFLAECGFDNASAHTKSEGAKVLFNIAEDNDILFRDRFEVGTQGLDATLDGSIDYHTTNDIVGPVPVQCGEEHLGAIQSTPGWGHVYDGIPEGFDGTSDGLISYTPPCDGPETETAVVSLEKNGSTAGPVGIWYEIDTTPPPGPTIEGLDYLVEEGVDNPVVDGVTDEVKYFCGTVARDTAIITEDDDVTYSIANDNPYAVIEEDTNLLRLGHPTFEECETLEGLVSTVLVRAEGANGGVTEFEVPIRGYRPQVKELYVKYGQKSDGTIQDPETILFDENKITEEVIDLTCDLWTHPSDPGQDAVHKLHLKPVVSHEELSQFTPVRGYAYEGANEPSWTALDPNGGVIYAKPGCDQLGLYFPSYTISSGPTDGPSDYTLRLKVTE